MSGSDITTVVVGIVAALAAVVAACVASSSAKAARLAQSEADKVALLERRLSERKYDTYREVIELFGRMLVPGATTPDDLVTTLRNFATWVTVTGSDEAVRTFGYLMQSTYNDAPPPVMLRLFTDFQLAARRDMGDPDTTLNALDLLSMRINDLFGDDAQYREAMTKPFAEVCADHDWPIPWNRTA